MGRIEGVRTARKLLVAFGIGLALISIGSVFALVYLFELNGVVRHLAFDPVPGSAAIAGVAKDFNEYRVLESSSQAPASSGDERLARKAAAIERELKAYDATITQADDRRRFANLLALWRSYRDGAGHDERGADQINALLTTMIDWNRVEGIRSTEVADSATRAATATVLFMLGTAVLLSALAIHFNRTVERPMNALAETARAIARGDREVRAQVVGPFEVATVARELNGMLDAWVGADAKARALHSALEESRDQLQRLTAGLLQGREEERTKVSREIHDVLGQTLTALKMDTGWIGARLPADASAIRAKLAAMAALIDETVVAVRRLATDLRPGLLDDLGLPATVEWQAQEFERRTGIACSVTTTVDETTDPLVATAVFRILQESLNNVARHSRASRVIVTLEDCGSDLVLEVHDDGVGIAPADVANTRSIGLAGMRERAQLVGGGFSISGAPGTGTTVRARVPRRATVSA
jgi:signal transduction histidine kinase